MRQIGLLRQKRIGCRVVVVETERKRQFEMNRLDVR